MIPSYYLAITSTLIHASCEGYATACIRGQWTEAAAAAARAADIAPVAQLPMLLQGCADACALTSDFEEAEQWYRRSTRRLAIPHEAQALSWRGTGIQAWLLDRQETAAGCFVKSAQHAATPQLQMEALVHLSVLCARLGLLDLAQRAAQRLDHLSSAALEPAWRAVAELLQEEVAVAVALHAAPALRDHGFWSSAAEVSRGQAPLHCADRGGAPSPISGLLAGRRRMLLAMSRLAGGDFAHFELLRDAMKWGAQQAVGYRGAVTLEVVKACIAGGHLHAADGLLRSLRTAPARDTEPTDCTPHHVRESAYCMYKMRRSQGRTEEAMDHFARYAACAMGELRRETSSVARIVSQEFPPEQPAKDEVSSRLPARYRRAYEFMLRSIDRSDLSIQEVANSIGVTERSLQATFKFCLGESPREVLRRLRLQRIREALQRHAGTNVSIMEVASKYGIANRTSLLVGFKKYFQEAPSELISGTSGRS